MPARERFRGDNRKEQRYGSAGHVMNFQPGKVMPSGADVKKEKKKKGKEEEENGECSS